MFNEQHQTLSGGNRTKVTDLHIEEKHNQIVSYQKPDSENQSLSGFSLQTKPDEERRADLQRGFNTMTIF